MNKIEREYKDLNDVIPNEVWKNFSFSEYYRDEKRILKPALENAGYTNITFIMGERDSFGPLSRIVIAYKDGVRFDFVYG